MACHMLVSLTEVVLLVAFEFKACSQNTHDRHLRKDCLKSLLGFCESLLVYNLFMIKVTSHALILVFPGSEEWRILNRRML